MSKQNLRLAVVCILWAAYAILLWGCNNTAAPTFSPTKTSTEVPTARMPAQKQWILVDLPAGASQLEYGAEVYRLVCQDCHGDRGQGLTDEWRATWAPADQNCWQSKCHAANHPPEGFVLPVAPGVVGPALTYRFTNALALHDFILDSMPWYGPKTLTDKDSWAVTAYILKMNNIMTGADLNKQTAALVLLR